MSEAKQKFPRAVALAVAAELCRELRPYTARLIVAGSLRRRKAEVGDVEILFVPRFLEYRDGLFETGFGNLAEGAIKRLLLLDLIRPRLNVKGRRAWGPENKLAVHVASGVPVDFFQASARNWWTLLVNRTGSKENNERICNAAIARGLKWNPYRGFEDRRSGELLFIPDSEQSVFARAGLPWLEPWER